MAKKLTARQASLKAARMRDDAEAAIRNPEFHPDPRVAARHLDGQIIRKRGETPPWEKEASDANGEAA